MKKNYKRWLSVLLICFVAIQFGFVAPPLETEAAAIGLYPIEYSYVRDAPYWTCSPIDQFPATQYVTIIEREGDYFYIEYTKDGQLRRGYTAMSSFAKADYTGYSWCDYTHYTPGYNNTASAQTTYYGPNSGHAASGAIDADEGENALKPLLVLEYSGNRAFVQYVTNPSTTGNALYKRAWVNSSCITLSKPTSVFADGTYTLIKNTASGKYLQLSYETGEAGLAELDPHGHVTQQWKLIRYYTAEGGYYYKIQNVGYNYTLELNEKLPIVGYEITLATPSSPNKAQEFTFKQISGNAYKIVSRLSGNYLVAQGNGTVTQAKPSSSTAQSWEFEIMNKYWDKAYTNLSTSNGKKVIPYYIDTGLATGIGLVGMTESEVESAVSSWNNAGANILLTRVYTKTSAKIRIQVVDDDEDSYYGQTVNSENNRNVDWAYANVNINENIKVDPNVADFTSDQRKKLICHELGHALKLMHPYGEGAAGRVVESVMCQGLFGTDDKIKIAPTAYDLRTIKNKWGES